MRAYMDNKVLVISVYHKENTIKREYNQNYIVELLYKGQNGNTMFLSIAEKLSLLGNHHFLTVYLIIDCTKCIRLYELSEK